ncbi:MAG: DUF2333 family protein [Desulfosarcinaceae bacterium]|nr:DUF2333 family protein [Desulfosarcinaceae bacterium]
MANPPKQDTEFKRFAAKRILIGIILAVAVLWTLGGLMGIIERPEPIPQSVLGGGASQEAQSHTAADAHGNTAAARESAAEGGHTQQDRHAASAKSGAHDDHGDAQDAAAVGGKAAQTKGTSHASTSKTAHGAAPAAAVTHAATTHTADASKAAAKGAGDHGEASHGAEPQGHGTEQGAGHGTASSTAGHGESGHASAAGDGHESAVSKAIAPKLPVKKAKGVATVEAVIAPIEYEIEERFWGWRPNDLINFTDNVNNYQRGVLEVTRRAVVALNERISRTGTTDAFDPDLENATNWFMIKATKYWFPSAESKYSEGIADLKKYRDSLQGKRATFYTRTDNLIPLLASFEDLLGSCDENLVKHVEEDGSEVSWFKSDNYFYYAQGVAAAMAPILEAIHDDFLITLETRHGIEILHHAVESCHTAAALKPWIITDSKLDGVLANHRANMAAPISHARFYLGVLIKALST